MLEEKISKDLVSAMKEHDKDTVNTLRAVKAAYKLELINKKLEPSDEILVGIINREIKMRTDSINEFNKAGRDDLASSYGKEIDILKKYMPESLSSDELSKIIDEVFLVVKPESIKDLGKVMKEITPKVKNKCDMSLLNKMIKDKLN